MILRPFMHLIRLDDALLIYFEALPDITEASQVDALMNIASVNVRYNWDYEAHIIKIIIEFVWVNWVWPFSTFQTYL